MGDMNFRDKLDLEMKDVVFTDKSRNKVLERAALHSRAAPYNDAVGYGSADGNDGPASRDRAAGHGRDTLFGNADMRDRAALHKGAVSYGSADGNGMAALSRKAALCGNTASPDGKASWAMVWRERLQSFMNLELRIPVKPLVVALLITVSGIVYACFGITRVSAEDIRNSSIAVVDSNQGGQADGIYKN